MTPDMAAPAVSARLREVGLRSDLRAERRLETKLDLRPSGTTRRLETVGSLTALCVRLGQRRVIGAGTAAASVGRLHDKLSRLAGLRAQARLEGKEREDPTGLARVEAEVAALARSIWSDLVAEPGALPFAQLAAGWTALLEG